ncbi:MAG: PKD domain-containing protein [Bacteroidetes bacterium]|nr:PKD domain-containing protein [Bacteroidota bacterium]
MRKKLHFKILLIVLFISGMNNLYPNVYLSDNSAFNPTNNTVVKGGFLKEITASASSKLNYLFPSTIDIKPINSNNILLMTSKACCPEFILKDAVEICPAEGSCAHPQSPLGNIVQKIAACKNTAHTYTVYPNDPSFTYTWTVTGGTPVSFTGNPMIIVWGSGTTGTIKVVTSNVGVGGSCVDSIIQNICLIDGPKANFTKSKDTVCKNTPVHFTNTSMGGSVYHWDFGDGTSSNLANPPDHSYSVPGTYTVLLTAIDMGSGQLIPNTQGEPQIAPCGCRDTISKKIVVLSGDGPVINYDCCFGTVCAGDTSSFCTTMVCGSYNWSVTGGTIISGAGTSCIKIKWFTTYVQPTTVTLQSCPSSACAGSTTLNVPVLYPNLPISGPTVICVGASGTYSLPWLPGTYYKWTVSGGLYAFNLVDRNSKTVNITFNTPGSFWVKCVYNNPLKGCSGADSVLVNVLPIFTFGGDEIVCEGTPKTYTANGAANWTISPAGGTILSGNGSSSIVASFLPGTYTITATPINTAAFCNPNAILKVEVKARPILGSINGSINACPGKKMVYSISSNKSGSPFIWSISGGTGTINSQMGDDNDSIVVEFSGFGPWVLSVYQDVEISPGVFCPSLTSSILINPYSPPIISGPGTLCADGVGTYTVGLPIPPGGYQWSISPASQGTIQSGQGSNSVTILWHGPSNTATLSVTSCAGNDMFPVIVNAPPTAVASYNILPLFCQGVSQTLILSTPFVGGYSYQWYQNNVLIPLATAPTLNINIAPLAVGTYQYYVKVTQNGCSVNSNIINVIIDNCTAGQPGGGPLPGSCDALAFFKTYVNCDKITLVNLSTVIAPATISSYLWAISGPGTGTFTPNANAATPGLTVNASGNYTITLTVTSSTGCITTWTQNVNVLLPNINFTYTTPVCVNTPVTFTMVPSVVAWQSFTWKFGDGATSYTQVTQHAYTVASPPVYTDSLIFVDPYGCIAKAANPITVNPLPNCTISASDTIFCPGGFVTLSACNGMSSYQWYKDGNPISGANNSTYNVNKIGEYWVEVTNGNGCSNTSNHIYIYMHSPTKAKITGSRRVCAAAASVVNVNLSTIFNTNYIYSWSSFPAGAVFSPSNTNATVATLTLPAILPVTYQFIVTVTDTVTTCTVSDTMCVTFFETPSLTVPYLNACQGTSFTLTPTPVNTVKYSYQWTNGATTPVIIAKDPGFYGLTITDKATGCSSSANAGFINPKPDLSLFPLGCASMCNIDTLHLYIPLPLNALFPNNTYANAYPLIKWYDNGNYATPIGSGQNLAFPSGTGNHQISVVVTNSYGCIDTAGVFCFKNDLCCTILLQDLHSGDASCPTVSDGWFSILLNPASVGGPFTITTNPLVPPMPTTITPGVPLLVSNLPSGTYTITISNALGSCIATYHIDINNKKPNCCFAEIDTTFHKITANITYNTNTVWDGKYYIADNVIVTVSSGATLDITTMDVVFGQCAGIDFINGGHLRASNSVFRPCNINGTWRGLRFVGNGQFSNIINESTFKNAEVALYFQSQSDGVVSNNLFSNCNYGVRVDNNNTFNHPISGNQFVCEQFFPTFTSCYSFVNNSSTYGIYTSSSRLLQQVSQNGFVNTKASNNPTTYGIYQYKGGGLLSSNTFTDQTYSILLNTAAFPSNIENNKIEVNVAAVAPPSSIYIDNSVSTIIEINNNEISNNFNKYNSNSAIYTRFSSNVSIVGNKINGFRYGIIAANAKKFQISSNVIVNPDINGIYFQGTGTDKNYITCNEIKMRNYSSTRGIYTIDLSTLSEITSNCITDCYASMDIRSFAVPTLPKIRNNYLYNYNSFGINVNGYNGNIGTLVPADPGINTLWSNHNLSIDINSNLNITVADNFGMNNVSFPQVQVVSNRPYYSTASCGHQIYNTIPQNNLNIKYSCDNYAPLFAVLSGSVGGSFSLTSDYNTLLNASNTQFDDANMILTSLENADITLLNQMLALSSLTENEKSILKYNYYYHHTDYSNARINMNNYNPKNADQTDFKYLRLTDLDVIENGLSVIDENTIQNLKTIENKKSMNSNFAISLLNNASSYRNYIFEEISLPDITKSGEIQQLGNNETNLLFFPNPASERVFIEVAKTDMVNGKIKLYDAVGKLVTDYNFNFVAGGIELDIHKLKSGIYFVTLTDDSFGLIQSGKLVKE